jgi:hypothetical protein
MWAAEVSSSKPASQEHPNCIATVQPAKVCPFRDSYILCLCTSSVAAAPTRQTGLNQLMSPQVAQLLLEARLSIMLLWPAACHVQLHNQ